MTGTMEFTIKDPQKNLQRVVVISAASESLVLLSIRVKRKGTRDNEIRICTVDLLRSLQAVFPEMHIEFKETEATA
jgi:hypothetical protein